MRTVIVVVIGLVVLALFAGLGPALGIVSRVGAAYAFIAVWLIFSVIDWYIGVYRAGYGAMEELRIHAVIFGIPAALALALVWVLRTR